MHAEHLEARFGVGPHTISVPLLLSMMPEALSGKTGFTGNAGYCYVAALKKDDKEFTVALLGCGWPPHKT